MKAVSHRAEIQAPRYPKPPMWKYGVKKQKVLQELRKAWEEDLHFSDQRILGSMCTEPLAVAAEAHAQFLEVNLGNPAYYKGTWRLEKEVIDQLAEMLHGRGGGGFTVSGGTEGNITAIWLARNATKRKKVVYGENAHFSVLKAADLLGLKTVPIGLDSEYRLDIKEAKRKIDRDTAAVVAVAGTTELGQVDPIEELAEICQDRVPLHVDAAFGGFVLPFLEQSGVRVPSWDFRVAGVSSIVLDSHKMGMSTIPGSALLVRQAEHFKKIAVESPYLTSVYQTSLLGTRNSAGVAATYAAMRLMGRDGYVKVVKRCVKATNVIVDRIDAAGLKTAVKPLMNVLGVMVKDIAGVQRMLEKHGWRTSMARHPRCLRVVVMPHISIKAAEAFSEDLVECCKKLGEI